jgi:2-hydroxychromene-2-carboxylate isomerase
MHIDFWFDFSCPYAYLAATQRHKLAAEAGVAVVPQPFLLGGVFRALGQAQNLSVTLSPPKARHNRLDVIRWASWFGVPIRTPLRHPNRTVEALRCLLACPASTREAVIDSFFAAYWVDQLDLSDTAVLRERLATLGLDAEAVLAASQGDAIKEDLRVQTDRALQAGVFGAPAFVVGDALFWGQDRLPMVAAAARGWQADASLEAFAF